MATDAKLTLQASVTKTATFNGAGVDLGTGTPRRGLKARVIYSAATNASGSNAFTFSIDHSDDNSTFYQTASGAADVVTLSTTAQAGEIFIPFETSKRYVRLTVTQAGAGSTPTITYQGDITMARP
jgi:hypothetical protein